MAISDRITEKEYKKRTDAVIDYIVKNINSDITLKVLSKVANYSPFHFQKVFKRVVGDTPKQYIVKLRLQKALHLIVIQPHKSIFEIGMDCGFSSLAVFSRAIKNHFGISPDKIRSLTPAAGSKIIKMAIPNSLPTWDKDDKMNVLVIKTETIKGIYLIVTSNDQSQIQQSFTDIVQLAKAYDIYSKDSNLFGILSPHQHNLYKVFLSVDKNKDIPSKFKLTEIKAGKFATFKLRGDKQETIKSVHSFFHNWLPDSGYKIDDIVGFETFVNNPADIPYDKLERTFCMPIKPI